MYAILSAATDFFFTRRKYVFAVVFSFLPRDRRFIIGTPHSALPQTASKILIDTNTRAEPFVPEVYNEGFTTAIPSSRIL